MAVGQNLGRSLAVRMIFVGFCKLAKGTVAAGSDQNVSAQRRRSHMRSFIFLASGCSDGPGRTVVGVFVEGSSQASLERESKENGPTGPERSTAIAGAHHHPARGSVC